MAFSESEKWTNSLGQAGTLVDSEGKGVADAQGRAGAEEQVFTEQYRGISASGQMAPWPRCTPRD